MKRFTMRRVRSIMYFLVVCSILISMGRIEGAVVCVSNGTELSSALLEAASNGENDVIRLVQGTYVGNFIYSSREMYDLTIEGGYTSILEDASREIDPNNTIMDANQTGPVLVLACDQAVNFVVEGLTLQNGKTTSYYPSGGGLYVFTNEGYVTLTNNTIINNMTISDGHGGGVYIHGGLVTLTDNAITNNTTGLDGNGAGAYINGDSVTLTNNTIINNTTTNSSGDGGGIYIDGNSDSFTDNTISDNSAGSGGGLYFQGTSVTLSDNIITRNTSTQIGGGVSINGNSAALSDNTISDNSTGSGGGLYFQGSSIILTNNIISNNNTTALNGDGGGVSINGNSVILSDNTISNNTIADPNSEAEGEGGGGYINGGGEGNITLINNVITGNDAGPSGGGLSIYGSRLAVITNNTISNNTTNNNAAISRGGSIFLQLFNDDDSADIYNNIIWNNSADEGSDLYIDNDGDKDYFYSSVDLFNNDFNQSETGFYIAETTFTIDPNNLNSDPLFVDPNNGDYHVNEGSPCIDAGQNQAPELPSNDKDGESRIMDGIVDIGAYEYPGNSFPTANAGPDQIVKQGATVTLDGSKSFDPDGTIVLYRWIQIGEGTEIILSDPSDIRPTFTALGGDSGAIITFQLTVTDDGGLSSSDTVMITILPKDKSCFIEAIEGVRR